MSYNPHIATARRAAKQLAREQGVPHQAALDLLAQRSGRADWDAFLADPVPMPIDVAMKAEAVTAEAEASTDQGVIQRTAEVSRRPHVRMTAATVLMAIVIVFLLGLTWRLMNTSEEASNAMVAMESDRVESTTLRFPISNRDMPVTSLVRNDQGLWLTVMVIDDRIASLDERRRNPHRIRPSAGGRTAALSMIDYPVTRFAGKVDCAAQIFLPQQLETADTYRGVTRFMHPVNPRDKIWRLSITDADRICSTPGRGDITSAIKRA